jgi:hypothetical protein
MSQYVLEIPEALVQAAQEAAQAQQTSLDDFVYAAIAEKVAASVRRCISIPALPGPTHKPSSRC